MPNSPRFSLELTIVQGRNLIAADRNGLSDPYCKVFLGGKEVAKTVKIREKKYTLDPVWDAKFVVHPAGEHDIMLLEVWDWDRLTSDDPLGNCAVPLTDVIRGVTFSAWYHLEDVPHGEIKVQITPLDFGAIQGKLTAPSTDPAATEIFGDVYTIKSTKYYQVEPGREGLDFQSYVGKFVRMSGKTVRDEVVMKRKKVYVDRLLVGEIELLE